MRNVLLIDSILNCSTMRFIRGMLLHELFCRGRILLQ
jgi:hypothetical protein